MGKLRVIELNETERLALEDGYEKSQKSAFRKRCHLILLKSQGYSASEISPVIGLGILSVYHWLDRYEAEGISGLNTKAGRGRKPILNPSDAAVIKPLIQDECQRLSVAKAHIEAALGRQFSPDTLKRFLKVMTADTNALESVRGRNRMRGSMSTKSSASPRLKRSRNKGI